MQGEKDFFLDISILKKEIELLILRGVLKCRIENDRLIF